MRTYEGAAFVHGLIIGDRWYLIRQADSLSQEKVRPNYLLVARLLKIQLSAAICPFGAIQSHADIISV